jgi:site-specific recombinase XerD
LTLTNETSLKERTKAMIESDKDVARWINNLISDSTKRIYSEGLLKYTEYAKQTPKEIITNFQTNKKQAEDTLTDFIHETTKKQTPKSVHNNLVSVKSWLKHNDIVINRRINCGNIKGAPTTEDESIPTQDEINRILDYSDLRGKAFISLIAFAGFRPTTAVNTKLKDITDLKITTDSINFIQTPAQIKVKAEFSKNTRPYFTFLSTEGCEYVLEYLRSRINEGEKLTPESTVLSFSQKSTRHSITRKGFSKKIKRTFERANYKGRPYVLRSYFANAILNSGLSLIYQQFLMGHAGTMEAIYTVNKNLPQSQIEDIRQQFKEKVEPKLDSITVKARNEIELLQNKITERDQQIKEINQKLTKFQPILDLLEGYPSLKETLKDIEDGRAVKIETEKTTLYQIPREVIDKIPYTKLPNGEEAKIFSPDQLMKMSKDTNPKKNARKN